MWATGANKTSDPTGAPVARWVSIVVLVREARAESVSDFGPTRRQTPQLKANSGPADRTVLGQEMGNSGKKWETAREQTTDSQGQGEKSMMSHALVDEDAHQKTAHAFVLSKQPWPRWARRPSRLRLAKDPHARPMAAMDKNVAIGLAIDDRVAGAMHSISKMWLVPSLLGWWAG
ncbi:uncharacterized protein PV09_08367 [Verruconis gallopava]|uniref:Uncharacterized protein n=1 Tax=Verruconis gallopava TaxID=253628 RepID=A0A0D2A165_9PEZI|nr:uncharacterized protein PV09_08367 [Verruconis gallopava]KIW00015.1 hypothetical protein PV09_08367 [Verruconis gallopava]